jgi:hypothetical protein
MKTYHRLLLAFALLFSVSSTAGLDIDALLKEKPSYHQLRDYRRVVDACGNTDFISNECMGALETIVLVSEEALHVLRGCRMIEAFVSKIDARGPELALACYARVISMCEEGMYDCTDPRLYIPMVKSRHDFLQKEILKEKVKAKFERTKKKVKNSFLEWLDE